MEKITTFSTFSTSKKDKIIVQPGNKYKQIKVQWYGKGAILRNITDGKHIKTKTQYVANTGDLIISKIDANKGAIALIPEELDGGVVTSDFPLFKINYSLIDKKYLDFYLRYGNIASIMKKYSKGTTKRQRIKSYNVLDLEIFYPDINIQKQIANRIEKQYEIITDTEKLVDSLIKGIVDSSDFHGEYEYKQLNEICEDIVSGGTPKRSKKDYFKGDIPWIKISDIKPLEILTHTEEKISKEALKESATKMLPKDTVIISIFASIGTVGILGIDACTNQAIAGLIPDNQLIKPRYLMYYLHYLKPYFEEKRRGVSQKNINLNILQSFKIPVPDLIIQQEIIDRIDQKKKLIIQLREIKKQALETISNIINDMELYNGKEQYEISDIKESSLDDFS